jgi:hypothetical protein
MSTAKSLSAANLSIFSQLEPLARTYPIDNSALLALLLKLKPDADSDATRLSTSIEKILNLALTTVLVPLTLRRVSKWTKRASTGSTVADCLNSGSPV